MWAQDTEKWDPNETKYVLPIQLLKYCLEKFSAKIWKFAFLVRLRGWWLIQLPCHRCTLHESAITRVNIISRGCLPCIKLNISQGLGRIWPCLPWASFSIAQILYRVCVVEHWRPTSIVTGVRLHGNMQCQSSACTD